MEWMNCGEIKTIEPLRGSRGHHTNMMNATTAQLDEGSIKM